MHTECACGLAENSNAKPCSTCPNRKDNRRNGTDRRTKDRRVEQVTYGTGSPLTVEEIEASNNVPTCETCGIIHVGRECRPEKG